MNLTRPQLVWIAALVAVAAAIVLLRDILLPFLAAIALAYLLDPVVERCERAGVSRTTAALGILILFFAGLTGLMVSLIPLLGEEVADFIDKLPQYIGQLQALAADPKRPWLRKIIGLGLSEAEQSAAELTSAAADFIPALLRSVWSDSRTVLSIFSLLIVTPIITLYLLIDWKHFIGSIDRLVPAPQRETVRALAGQIDSTIAAFLRGQGTICLILAVYYAAALRLAGLNHGILIGVAAGLISFIPYLGFFAGIVASVTVAVLQFWPDWTMIPVILAIFVLGQAIADYVLAPYLIASKIHLNPAWAMFALAAFGYLFGFVGLLIAVPAAAAIGVLVRFAAQHYPAPPLSAAAEPEPLASAEAPPPSRKSWLRSLLGS
jgi:predicted PurR-regulated permease PerM